MHDESDLLLIIRREAKLLAGCNEIIKPYLLTKVKSYMVQIGYISARHSLDMAEIAYISANLAAIFAAILDIG